MPDSETPRKKTRSSGWPQWLAVGLMALGATVSVGLALVRTETQPSVAGSLPEGAAMGPGWLESQADFVRIQSEMDAALSPAQQFSAALAMVEFLLKSEEWRPEHQRLLMAREYLLALANMNLDGPFRFRVAHHLFDLALVLQDTELLASGEALLRMESVVGEPVPLDLLCAGIDALLELGDPIAVYMRIDELGARLDGPEGYLPHLQRVARGLRRALEDKGALRALFVYRNAGGSPPTRDTILAELDETSLVLAACGQTPMEAEGLWHQAYLARERGLPDAEIDILQQVIAKGISGVRPLAYMRLADRMRDEKRDLEHAVLLSRMIGQPELRKYAMDELQQRLQSPSTSEIAEELLRSVDQILVQGNEMAHPLAQLLMAAGRMAMEHGWMPMAERYLEQAQALTLDRELLADRLALQAEIAKALGNREEMVRAYQAVINLYPDHLQEADIRFLLLQEMAAQPYSEADLVGGIIGAITRLPKDPRGIRGLLMVGKRLDDLKLYDLAETYYRLAVLLSTMQQTRDASSSTAEALLGQARAMAAQGKLVEADTLLRVLNTNARWSGIWSASGPLWASLAFRQGQFREGVRRWRQTCGPLGGELLPYLFGLLAPDLGQEQAPVPGSTPRKPGRMPQDLVEAAVAAAMEQFLDQNDYAAVERLIAMVENDPEWGNTLSLDGYRMRVLKRLAANESYDRTVAWLKLHPVEISVADPSAPAMASALPGEPEVPELTNWLNNVEAIRTRVRALPQ